MPEISFANPFRPSAGHMPPYLAGRIVEREGFKALLRQPVITDNAIITGLRGVGKSVLLESLKPMARDAKWLWTGDDLTEATSLSEDTVVERILTDLSLTLGAIFIKSQSTMPFGFSQKSDIEKRPLGYNDLRGLYERTPGLSADKLKVVFRYIASLIQGTGISGIVFAYDEAQNLSDQATENQFPLSLLLDVFQSIQRSPGGIPFLLVLTGLPTLFPKLNETRTYTERMFQVFTLDRLTPQESREAILTPIMADPKCPVNFADSAVDQIIEMSGGYPFFIQFICREFFDLVIAKIGAGQLPSVPREDIIRKLDQRFFSARWDNASDRQREFMKVASLLPGGKKEFTVQELVQTSREILGERKKFTTASAGMMLKTLSDLGFVFRNRRGKYSFTVPLLDEFILRQMAAAANLPSPFGAPSAS